MGYQRTFRREMERLQGLPNAKTRRFLSGRRKKVEEAVKQHQNFLEQRMASSKVGSYVMRPTLADRMKNRIKSFLNRKIF